MYFVQVYFQIAHIKYMLYLFEYLERTLWPAINVGLDLRDVVHLLGMSCQLGRLKLHASTSLGPLQWNEI